MAGRGVGCRGRAGARASFWRCRRGALSGRAARLPPTPSQLQSACEATGVSTGALGPHEGLAVAPSALWDVLEASQHSPEATRGPAVLSGAPSVASGASPFAPEASRGPQCSRKSTSGLPVSCKSSGHLPGSSSILYSLSRTWWRPPEVLSAYLYPFRLPGTPTGL